MGISIAIEGPEGAGKSWLTKATEILLNETTEFTIASDLEPGGTKLGAMLRTVLKGEEFQDIHPLAHTFMFCAQRAELFFKEEMPFLNENFTNILIKDRSWLSTVALQTVDGVDLEFIESIQKPFMVIPNKFAIVDTPVQETVVRMDSVFRYSSEREIDWRDKQTQDNLARIRQNYMSFALKNRERCFVLDCFDDPWEKAARIKFEIFKVLAKEGGFVLEEGTQNLFIQEAKLVGDQYASKEGGQFGRFSIKEDRERVEEVRKELGYPSREELRAKMHEEWRAMGLEGAGVGIERK